MFDRWSEGCDYVVAEGYAWEVAGYFWDTGACNDIVDGLEPNDPESVDKVADYKELMMVIQ